jgi:hypothetical protein
METFDYVKHVTNGTPTKKLATGNISKRLLFSSSLRLQLWKIMLISYESSSVPHVWTPFIVLFYLVLDRHLVIGACYLLLVHPRANMLLLTTNSDRLPQVSTLLIFSCTQQKRLPSKDWNFTHGYMHHGYRIRMSKVWAHIYINSCTHILPIKSCVWHMHILVPMGIPLPYLFILACRSIQLSSARVDQLLL